ncbi:MAG TPA: hypothetical protein VMJ12_03455, partial [Candidatus Acidoferrales bacterium]|nr:hypothetical protein [Candidatus Acidoferrales bacterium]
MKTSILRALVFFLCLSGIITSRAAMITINPSDDGALYTCTECNTVNNGGYVLVSGYIQGIVIFPTA